MTRKLIVPLVACCAALATPAAAQQSAPLGYKDPQTSTLVSVLVPGGGHLYSGETKKGATLLGIGLGGLVLGAAATTSSVGVDCDSDFTSCEDDTNYAPMVLGYAAYLGSWIYGIIDAGDSANRMNGRRGLSAVVPEGVTPVVAPTQRGGTQIGMSVAF